MLTPRQQVILKAIVEEFIKNAEPVGSKTLLERYQLNYSSATIRNEMQYLENEGYLEKTHTSSGRVPSTQGYKYYVENLMEASLSDEEKYQLTTLFEPDIPLDDVVQKSCDILSNMTSLTSLVLGPDANKQTLAHIRLFPLDEHSAVAVFITDTGHTENKTFHFEDEVSVEDLQNCTAILNDRLTGTPINEVVEKLNEIRPIIASSVKRHEALFNAFLQAFTKFANENVYYSGASNMLYQPEFADREKIKALLMMLEDSSIWRRLSTADDTMKIESSEGNGELVWMNDMAIVSRDVVLGDGEGKLMVVGPSRMDYNRVVSILDFTSSFIERQYSKRKK